MYGSVNIAANRTQSVLVVDDSPIARMIIKRLLRSVGLAKVREAESGSEAIRMYESDPPGLVFLDLTMPEVTGYDVLARIQSTDEDAFIVVLTADRQEETAFRARALGARRVLYKPPSPEEVRSILDEAGIEV